jgi:integrase
VLSSEEITRILDRTTNLKHWTIIATFYATGLRCNELRNLKTGDIDSHRLGLAGHLRFARRYERAHDRVSECKIRALLRHPGFRTMRPADTAKAALASLWTIELMLNNGGRVSTQRIGPMSKPERADCCIWLHLEPVF